MPDPVEYAEYVRRVRQYRKEMSIEEAVERAITECIAEGILRDFLIKNRAEAKAVSIYEYSEEEHIRMEREDAFEDGRKSGIEQEKKRTPRKTSKQRLHPGLKPSSRIKSSNTKKQGNSTSKSILSKKKPQ